MNDARSPDTADSLPFTPNTPYGRPSWSGLLQFSLVGIPLKAFPAVRTRDVPSAHLLHADCGQRIRYAKQCPVHGTVESAAIVRGYEYVPRAAQEVLFLSSQSRWLRAPISHRVIESGKLAMTEREMFEAALEQPPERRPAFLDGICGGDTKLRRRLESLMKKNDLAGSFLESPASVLTPAHDDRVRVRPGRVIGPYKLLEQIGEGGMGLDFVAEQQRPVKRRVALKIIKPGMDSRQVIARFEVERQALAMMDHPNIAKVHDGGTTPEGRPYFVMEFVKGTPITDYCDQHRLTSRQRLELFLHVCQAVQHAHQKGIIHRDIKPTNVLVSLRDVSPVVKVIDFGIAKATGQQRADNTVYTAVAQMIGTQVHESGAGGAERSRRGHAQRWVFVGVLLYELLTGTTPFESETLKTAGYDEMRRIIREEEPAKPRTRVSTLGQAAVTVSANRQSDPKRLSQLFRGELDWIVMKSAG